MAKWNFLQFKTIFHRLNVIGFTGWLVVMGLFSTAVEVQAATLIITSTGSSLPAFVGTPWSQTFSVSGGTAPYTCSMVGSIPGMSFNAKTCILSGTPSDFGNYSVSIHYSDSETNQNTATFPLNFKAEVSTQITMDLRSDHPDGPTHYMVGFPVWVHAKVTYSPAIAGKKPVGTITISSGVGEPACSFVLDSNGEGECALFFTTSGAKVVQVDFPGDTYVHPDTATSNINVESLQIRPTLSSGRNHTCYLSGDGLMNCWGLVDEPAMNGSGHFTKISAGGYQTCALNTDGTISCWGDNTDVTQNIPTGKYLDISSGDDHVCAIGTNHKLSCWGFLSTSLAIVPTENVVSVSSGVTFDCAVLMTTKQPVCWGSNTTSPAISVKDLAVGNTHTCAIKTNGSLACWGSPSMTVPVGTSYIRIDSGSNYSCAQKNDGKIECWGTGNPGVDKNVVYDQFSSGFLHTCSLQPKGSTDTLSCWGDNTYGKAPAIKISPTSLAGYLVKGRAFNQIFTSQGGNSPYTVSVVNGSLPSGLVLNGSTISGILTASNGYSFVLSSAESFLGSGLPLELTPVLQSYTTTVIDGTTISSLSLPPVVDAGSPATAHVTVRKIPPAPVLTGDVLISSTDGDTSCRAAVGADGVAECALYFSTPGSKQVIAEYQGNEYYQGSSVDGNINVNPVVISPTIGAGDQFSCSINNNGRVTCWGNNDSNQSSPPAAGVYKQIDIGKAHACALGLNRRVTCWGWNGYNIATAPATNGVAKVTTGNTHSCFLTDAGTISCWGENTSSRLSITGLGFGQYYTDLDAGANHTCAIVNDGSVQCWGMNSNSQTDVPWDLVNRGKVTKISSGETFSCGLHENGALECWGGVGVVDSIRSVPAGSYMNVSAGKNFACALKSNGKVTCWGGLSTAPASTFTEIASGFDHVCGLLSDGGMQCWGNNTLGQAPVINITPVNLATVDAGVPLVIQTGAAGGRVSQYSFSVSSGELPPGLTLNSNTGLISGTPTQAGTYAFTLRAQEINFTPALAAEKPYSLIVRGWVDAKIESAFPFNAMAGSAVRVNFTVHAQPGNGVGAEPTGTVIVSAEGNRCEVPLSNGMAGCSMIFANPGKKQITISYPGDGFYQPGDNLETVYEYTVVPFSQNPQLRSGLDHTYIYKADGTVGCVGFRCATDKLTGLFTQLGVGDDYACGLRTNGEIDCVAYGSALVIEFKHGPYIDLSVGKRHVCALRIDQQVECLGDQTSGKATPPAELFSSLSAGGGHTCGLTGSGAAVCWGAITTAPAGVFTRLVSGEAHSCGIRADGSVICWGDDGYGQTDVPASPALFTEIAAGGSQTCGLDSAGAVFCWGDPTHGQTQRIYGSFIALATYDDHVCALRDALQLSCWGEDDSGEAPQFQLIPLSASQIPALTYFEHEFNILGGTKPLTALVEGNLPPGMDVNSSGKKSGIISGGMGINDLSPAGMILFGTPNLPGIYPFVLRWIDVSPYPLVMELPYSLTITGGDLSVELTPKTPADALEGNPFSIKAVVVNKTALPVPDVVLSITLPGGFVNVSIDDPACTQTGLTVTCSLGTVNSAEQRAILVSGYVTARSGQALNFNANVESTHIAWPEIIPADNVDSLSVPVALKAVVYSEGFDQSPFNAWTSGTPQVAPNGQTYLSGNGNSSLKLDLSGLPAHKNILIHFDLYVIGGWKGNHQGDIPSEWKFGQVGSLALLDTSFCNDPECAQAYPGWLSEGVYPGRTGAVGVNELGLSVSGNSVPDSHYQMTYKFPHNVEDLHLVFSSLNLPEDASWGLDDVIVEIDSGFSQVFLPFMSK